MESKLVLAVFLGLVTLCSGASLPVSKAKSLLGVVDDFYKCGGLGTFIQLRISDCEGRCTFVPGRPYDIEGDYFPSGSIPSLSIGVDLIFNGTPIRIMEKVLDNSSVQPGFIYTVKFTIVPNDILEGQVARFRALLFRTDNRLLEVCVETEVDISNSGIMH